jgi:hypothetical protein
MKTNMLRRTALVAVLLSLSACGGGGSDNASPAPAPVVVTPPVVVAPPVVVPPEVTVPPVEIVPPVVVPPVYVEIPINLPDPSITPCAAPTVAQPTVLWDQTPMVAMCDHVFVEPGISAFDEATLRLNVTAAQNKVTAFFGTLQAVQSDIILCKTPACRSYFLGTWAGVTAGAPGIQMPGGTYITARPSIMIVYTSFVGYGRNTLAHEWSHAEFQQRVVGQSDFPAWFNEGLAVVVSKDPDCSPGFPKGVADLRTLDSGTAWNTTTQAFGPVGTQVYCQANGEVEAWLTKNGKPALLSLLDTLKTGADFYTLYGPLLTQ